MANSAMPVAMTVAGSDSGGGAGVQADLKTFAALGVYGASALTAITAQNTVAVTAVHELPIDLIAAQIEAVVSDIGVDAVKTGMLSSSEIVEVVARELDRHGIKNLVVDPVMIAKSGDPLLRQEAVDSVRTLLVPLACIVTPNVPEAETLTGMKVETDEDMREAARRIIGMGARAVVVKGGHREGPATDLFYDGTEFVEFTSDRFDTVNTHGTGCTFASATAAGLAQGKSVVEAVAQAKEYVTEAIRNSYPLGQGHGPVHHFWQLWDKS